MSSSFFTKRKEPLRLAVAVALVGGVCGGVVARSVGSGWLPAIGLAILFGAGLFLWALDANRSWGNLGEGLLVSVVVAVVLLVVQRDADERQRESERHREEEVRRTNERQSLRLTIGLRRNLSGIDLRGRDLRGAYLADKTLDGATLDRAQLERAILRDARLRRVSASGAGLAGADLTGADLTDSDLVGQGAHPSDLREARLSEATLERTILIRAALWRADLHDARARSVALQDADLREANLRNADLTAADLRDADLRGAALHGARLCDAQLEGAKLNDVKHSASTRWPASFDPVQAGLFEPDPALPASLAELSAAERQELGFSLRRFAITEGFARATEPQPAVTIPRVSPRGDPRPTPSSENLYLAIDRLLSSGAIEDARLTRILTDLRSLPPAQLVAAIFALENAESAAGLPRCRSERPRDAD